MSASRAAGILFGLVSMAACGGLAREETVAAAPAVAEPAAADLLPAGRRLGDGLLVGAQPSLEQLGRLHDLGYRTAVSLRTEGEGGPTPEQVEALGLSFLRLPVADDRDVDRDRAQTLDVVLGGVEGPVVLYCGSGNRVGALLALRAHYVGGLPPEEALRAGREAGLTGLEPVVRERLGLPRE